MESYLEHYGTKRHSGRYKWGSGDNPYQHEPNFYLRARKYMKENGLDYTQMAKLWGMSTNEFKKQMSLSRLEHKTEQRALYDQLRAEGLNRTECGRRLGVSESTLRSWENENTIKREKVVNATVDILKKNVDEKHYIDVGSGVSSGMGITKNRLDTAVQAMVNDGYVLHNIQVEQITNPGKFTTVAVLCEPGTTKAQLYAHAHEIGLVNDRFETPNGLTTRGIFPPRSISSNKIEVVYGEDGGAAKDGLIELRRGAEGLDMCNANYAQVRIAVDGKKYLKGVAVYADDLPDGVDIRFNTNKSRAKGKLGVMKDLDADPDNPFGSTINYQNRMKLDGPEDAKNVGYLNIVQKEGDWQEWSKTLSSQFLSKQPVTLAKQQLALTKQQREIELKDIMRLENPTVKKHELEEFADKCDTAAVHLKAVSMPSQSNSLILPVNSLKPNEVYARNYENGTEVVLVRHPHGGTFELPLLKVNNRNKEAIKMMGAANDAIGINSIVASQLSGADFDGDTVIVIPNNSKKIKTHAPYQALLEFDTKSYAFPEGTDPSKFMKASMKQREMGIASNLISDMHLRDASEEDIIKAVKYSMVVIDSEKHHLDYKQAKKDFGITELKRKYQQQPSEDGKEKFGGASTLISRSRSEIHVPERRQVVKIDPDTGEKIYFPTNRSYVNKKGETIFFKEKSTQMREAKDAFDLVSTANNGTGTAMERVYAQYANAMKALGNQARRASVHVKENEKSPEMAKKYAAEVDSLKTKLTASKAWSPKERNAQLYANWVYKVKLSEDPDMTDDTKKKIKGQALISARARLDGTKPKVSFTDKEWEAIQAGAISKTMLRELLKYADSEEVKERALPKSKTLMTPSKLALARAKLKAGYSYQQIAEDLGVSKSTLQRAINGK